MRRSLAAVLCLASTVTASSCRDALAPERAQLVGEWATKRASIGGGSTYQMSFRFDGDGSYETQVTNFGAYGQGADAVSSYVRFQGRYYVSCDKLFLAATLQITWDSFYGAASPPRVEKVPLSIEPGPGDADPCGAVGGYRYSRVGDVLVFSYLSYPADAPVETTMVLYRMR